jgi:hypothetical protein
MLTARSDQVARGLIEQQALGLGASEPLRLLPSAHIQQKEPANERRAVAAPTCTTSPAS